jgi:hypothetical protein
MCLVSVISTAVAAVVFLHEIYISLETVLEVIVSEFPCMWTAGGDRNFYILVCYSTRRVPILNYFVRTTN